MKLGQNHISVLWVNARHVRGPLSDSGAPVHLQNDDGHPDVRSYSSIKEALVGQHWEALLQNGTQVSQLESRESNGVKYVKIRLCTHSTTTQVNQTSALASHKKEVWVNARHVRGPLSDSGASMHLQNDDGHPDVRSYSSIEEALVGQHWEALLQNGTQVSQLESREVDGVKYVKIRLCTPSTTMQVNQTFAHVSHKKIFELSVCTVNLWFQEGEQFGLLGKALKSAFGGEAPEFIGTQESMYRVLSGRYRQENKSVVQFPLVYRGTVQSPREEDLDGGSRELGYSVDTSRLRILHKEVLHDEVCRDRYNLVTRVLDKSTNTEFTVAIVHLCGGRDEDLHFVEYKGCRQRVIVNLIEKHNPDVVLGDFNGVPELDTTGNPVNTERFRPYVANILGFGVDEDSYKKFVSWLQEPDMELRVRGYARVPQDEATTPFGHNVDHIYYRRNGVFKQGVVPGSVRKIELFDMGKVEQLGMFRPNGNTDSISDHHAVCVRLMF